jgi:hypothetical protein
LGIKYLKFRILALGRLMQENLCYIARLSLNKQIKILKPVSKEGKREMQEYLLGLL